MLLANKTCVITGAANPSCIGQGIAEIFAKNGAKLILLDISSINLNKFDQDLKKSILFCLKCDVSSENNIKNTMQQIKQKIGDKNKIDILVNNAAVFNKGSVLDATESDWNSVLNVNIKGYALMIKHCVPIMNKGGSIVNISSISAFRAQWASTTPYNTSKAGIIQLTRNVAVDLCDKYNIRCNVVCPGIIKTKALSDYMNDLIKNGIVSSEDEWINDVSKFWMIKRLGSIYDVGYAVLFFASDQSKYCTGTHLMVDGGWCAL